MAALKPTLFLDTSVLLAGVIELHPPNPHAHAIMEAVADGRLGRPATAFHCCLEFYSVATRLPVEYRVSVADAERLVQEELLARFEVLDLPRGSRGALFALAASDEVAGGRVYDLHIAEVARAGGATVVLTENRRHFASLLRYGMTVLTSAEFAPRLPRRR
jgi:predicted nucleic acid-binding protein